MPRGAATATAAATSPATALRARRRRSPPPPRTAPSSAARCTARRRYRQLTACCTIPDGLPSFSGRQAGWGTAAGTGLSAPAPASPARRPMGPSPCPLTTTSLARPTPTRPLCRQAARCCSTPEGGHLHSLLPSGYEQGGRRCRAASDASACSRLCSRTAPVLVAAAAAVTAI